MTENQKLKDIAEGVRKKSDIPEDEVFGSVIAILMIISIILTLVRVLQECNKAKMSNDFSSKEKIDFYGSEIRSLSVKRGWFTKMRIKKVIRKNMSKDQYVKYNSVLLSAILNTGESLMDDEVYTIVEAANV